MFVWLVVAFAGWGIALMQAGCGSASVPGPTHPVDIGPDLDEVWPVVSYSDLADVLDVAVDDDGFLVLSEFDDLDLRGRLLAQLRKLAVTGPSCGGAEFKDPNVRLAYWCNAKAAWSIRLALDAGGPAAPPRESFEERPFPMDGRTMSLAGIDREIDSIGGFQAVAAAPSVRRWRSRLPAKPFDSNDVRCRTLRRFDAYVDDPVRFIIDVDEQEILVHPVIWAYRESLMSDFEARYGSQPLSLGTVLIEQVQGSAKRRLQDAVGYEWRSHAAPGPLACKAEWTLTD